MKDATNMSTPVTRGELRDELQELERRSKAELAAAIAPLATKAELAAAVAPLATKAELAAAVAPLATKAELAKFATKTDLEIWGGALLARIEGVEQRLSALSATLSAEIARHIGALHESMVAMFAAGDEKYADLPGRVKRLEATVFAPRRR